MSRRKIEWLPLNLLDFHQSKWISNAPKAKKEILEIINTLYISNMLIDLSFLTYVQIIQTMWLVILFTLNFICLYCELVKISYSIFLIAVGSNPCQE